jgi:hypothetical protein
MEVTEAITTISDVSLEVEKGYVDQSEIIYENHKRGRNWVANVVHDPGAPGYLDREFWESNGKNKEVPEDLGRGQIIEIAADYYTSGNNKQPKRRYFRVLSVGTEILLQSIDKPESSTPGQSEWLEKFGVVASERGLRSEVQALVEDAGEEALYAAKKALEKTMK